MNIQTVMLVISP